MRIGIHKLGFEDVQSVERQSEKDKNGMMKEVKLLMHVFAWNGFNVNYVETNKKKQKELYDIIFVFNGIERDSSHLMKLKRYCKTLNFILTDTRLMYTGGLFFSVVDNFFVQSSIDIYKNGRTYNSNLHKLPLYESGIKQGLNMTSPLKERNNRLIFGGSLRGREKQIREFLFDNEYADLYLKLSEKDDKRIPIDLYREKLKEYSYGLVIIDPFDAEVGNVTWRYYEYVANGVLTFVDRKSDPNNELLEKDSFMYVSSKDELESKIEKLNDKALKSKMVKMQEEKITLYILNGRIFVDSLINVVEKKEDNKC